MRYVLILLILFYSGQLSASPLAADIAFAKLTDKEDLTLRRIDIDSSFTGMKMLLFGVRHDAGDVVVVIRGPQLSYIVRKKERVAGIWMNRKHGRYDSVNGFYAIAASRPIQELRNDYLLESLGIDKENIAWFSPTLHAFEPAPKDELLQALLQKEYANKLYNPKLDKVNFIGDTLFRTVINFPENIPRGTYTAEVYLFRDGKLIGIQSTPLLVKKSGFDAMVFDFAYKWPILYGIIAVLIALFAGWFAGIVFKRI